MISNSFLFCNYNIISSLLEKFSLILEHGKMEVFHFSRSHEAFNLSQIRYSLVVILELNGVSEVQYKDVMMIDDGKYQ